MNADEFEHQRFSMATFVGLNFPMLKAYFWDQESGFGDVAVPNSYKGMCKWVEPSGDEGGIHSRLLGKDPGSGAYLRFQETIL